MNIYHHTINLHLYRHSIGGVACDGTLHINGIRICDTAENAKHRPPVGNYRIVLRHSKIHGRKVPMLQPLDSQEMPTSTPPCLTIGNGIFNRKDGRIIVGNHIVPGCLKCSRETFVLLYNRINKSQRRGHEVTLTITER